MCSEPIAGEIIEEIAFRWPSLRNFSNNSRETSWRSSRRNLWDISEWTAGKNPGRIPGEDLEGIYEENNAEIKKMLKREHYGYIHLILDAVENNITFYIFGTTQFALLYTNKLGSHYRRPLRVQLIPLTANRVGRSNKPLYTTSHPAHTSSPLARNIPWSKQFTCQKPTRTKRKSMSRETSRNRSCIVRPAPHSDETTHHNHPSVARRCRTWQTFHVIFHDGTIHGPLDWCNIHYPPHAAYVFTYSFRFFFWTSQLSTRISTAWISVCFDFALFAPCVLCVGWFGAIHNSPCPSRQHDAHRSDFVEQMIKTTKKMMSSLCLWKYKFQLKLKFILICV